MKSASPTPETAELLPTAPANQPPAEIAATTSDVERILTMIERAGSDPQADVSKMERMFALYKDMVHLKEKREFNEAMLAVQNEAPAIVRDSINPSTNSKFAKLEKIQEVLKPILERNRLTVSFGTDQSSLPEHYGVTCLVSRGGFERMYRCDVPSDHVGMKGNPTKTKTHGFGSALSYGERYLLKLIFNIRLIGEDDDGNHGQRPKQSGPQTSAPSDEVKTLVVKLWNVLKPVRGTKHDWDAANDWLIKNDILDGAVDPPMRAPNLDAATLRAVIAKASKLLPASG